MPALARSASYAVQPVLVTVTGAGSHRGGCPCPWCAYPGATVQQLRAVWEDQHALGIADVHWLVATGVGLDAITSWRS